MDSIPINGSVRNNLVELQNVINDASAKQRLILNTFVETKGLDGAYEVSADFSEMVKKEEAVKEE